MDNTKSNTENDPVPSSGNAVLFGTSSTDIVEGLHHNAFAQGSAEPAPGDDEKIVNEQDQQEIVNLPEEEIQQGRGEPNGAFLPDVPGIEKDLLDKNILEERELPGEEDTSDDRAI